MTIEELYELANAVLPSSVTPSYCGIFVAKWQYKDLDGEVLALSLSKYGKLTMQTISEDCFADLSPDFLLWLGVLGGLVLELKASYAKGY